MGAKMPAAYWRAYRARRRAEGDPVRRREGYVRDRAKERKYGLLGRPRRIEYATAVEIPRFDPHPLVDEAIAHLTKREASELGQEYDSFVGDLVGTYVLAAIEGSDAAAAMKAFRLHRHDELAVLVFGTEAVTDLAR